jgi:hypothetical protein
MKLRIHLRPMGNMITDMLIHNCKDLGERSKQVMEREPAGDVPYDPPAMFNRQQSHSRQESFIETEYGRQNNTPWTISECERLLLIMFTRPMVSRSGLGNERPEFPDRLVQQESLQIVHLIHGPTFAEFCR